jgi:hypothetical protein
MGPRPDEGLVAKVMEITQCPRKDAELALKVPRPLPHSSPAWADFQSTLTAADQGWRP